MAAGHRIRVQRRAGVARWLAGRYGGKLTGCSHETYGVGGGGGRTGSGGMRVSRIPNTPPHPNETFVVVIPYEEHTYLGLPHSA
jgi:hypothetical protein